MFKSSMDPIRKHGDVYNLCEDYLLDLFFNLRLNKFFKAELL